MEYWEIFHIDAASHMWDKSCSMPCCLMGRSGLGYYTVRLCPLLVLQKPAG